MNFTTTILITAAMAMATGVNASAKAKADSGRQVTVYYCVGMSVEPSVEGPARDVASKMFSNIGVHINWRSGCPTKPEAGAVVVEFVTGTPATFKPGALAYALPYEGVHIRILADRLAPYSNPRSVLAHVMAHEITHILQGEARHSEEGVMKAKWTVADFQAMSAKPLSFTAEDVELINRGMNNREAQILAGAKPSTNQTAVAATAEPEAK